MSHVELPVLRRTGFGPLQVHIHQKQEVQVGGDKRAYISVSNFHFFMREFCINGKHM
jgi:hypothetical protein